MPTLFVIFIFIMTTSSREVVAQHCDANICPVTSTNSSSTFPQACPLHSNTYVSGASSLQNCSCMPGFFSSSGPQNCIACAAGSITNVSGQTSCRNCNAGSFSSTTGSTICMTCAQDTFSVAGSSLCAQCPVGSSSQAGASACTVKAGYYDLGQSLMAYYTFDAANMVADSAPTPLGALTASGTPTAVAGQWNGSSAVDGTFSIPTFIWPYSGAFSVCMWYKPTVVSSYGFAFYLGYSGGRQSLQVSRQGVGDNLWIMWNLYTPGAYSNIYGGYFTTFAWNHICVVSYNNNNSGVVYLNGASQGPARVQGVGLQGPTAGNMITGTISDEFRMYPRALSQAEVSSVYGYNGVMTTATMPVLCAAGSFSATANTSACSLCSSGSFSSTGASICSLCSMGQYCASGSTSAVACALGSYCPTPSNQTACDLGNYCEAASTTQSPCSGGSYCPNPSTKSTCTIGNYCPLGSYTQTPCKVCSPFSVQLTTCDMPALVSDQSTCRCNDGYAGDGFNCTTCSAGSWCTANIAIGCPQFTNSPPQTGQQNGCTCNIGYYWTGSVNGTSPCALCAAGSYCAGGNVIPSITCPPNANSAAGSSLIGDCICKPGFYALKSNGSCTLCPAGSYCSSGNLSICPSNSSSTLVGAYNASVCVCNAGFYGDPSACQSCPLNAFCLGGQPSYTNCTSMAVTADVGSINSSACYCDRGWAGTDNSPCSRCVAGQWCWTGKVNTCPNNTMSGAGASWINNCTCNVGYSGQGGGPSCGMCSAGTYCAKQGCSACTACGVGGYATGIGGTNSSTCSNCSVGTYNNLTTAWRCVGCAAGSYTALTGSSSCSSCTSGYYMPIEGSMGCIPCPYNTHTSGLAPPSSALACTCLPSWSCTYTRAARTQVQMITNMSWSNLTSALNAWALQQNVQLVVNLV